MIMAAIGGCWWPLEVVPAGMRAAAHFFPTAWAMDALHQLISYGNGLAQVQVLKPLAVLVAVATAAHLAAAKYFRL